MPGSSRPEATESIFACTGQGTDLRQQLAASLAGADRTASENVLCHSLLRDGVASHGQMINGSTAETAISPLTLLSRLPPTGLDPPRGCRPGGVLPPSWRPGGDSRAGG